MPVYSIPNLWGFIIDELKNRILFLKDKDLLYNVYKVVIQLIKTYDAGLHTSTQK